MTTYFVSYFVFIPGATQAAGSSMITGPSVTAENAEVWLEDVEAALLARAQEQDPNVSSVTLITFQLIPEKD